MKLDSEQVINLFIKTTIRYKEIVNYYWHLIKFFSDENPIKECKQKMDKAENIIDSIIKLANCNSITLPESYLIEYKNAQDRRARIAINYCF